MKFYLQFQNMVNKSKINKSVGFYLLSSTSSATWETSAATTASHRFADGGRTFWPQRLNAFGAPGGCTLGKWARIQITIEIGISQFWADRQPSGTNARITAKQMQSSTSQTEMLDDVEYFDWFIVIAKRFLFRNNEIDIDVGMNKIAISGASHGALDAHQAMLLRALKHCLRLEYLRVAGIIDVRTNPANIFATTEAPFTQAISAHIQSLGTAAPQKHETSMCSDLINF